MPKHTIPKNLSIKCPVCQRFTKVIQSGVGLYYLCCPAKNDKHIFEVGPYTSLLNLEMQIAIMRSKSTV